MTDPIVICDHGAVNASLVPAACLGAPGGCPAGVYETMLWENGRMGCREEHLERLWAGCGYAGIEDCLRGEKIFNIEALDSLVRLNGMGLERCRVRLMAFRQPQALADRGKRAFAFLAALWPAAVGAPDAGAFGCAVSSAVRAAGDESFNYKMLGRRAADDDLRAALGAGFNDVLYFNNRDELCEAAYSNVWLVKDDELFTPPVEAPCLPGIVRSKIIAGANNLGVSVHYENPVERKDLAVADEVFLSSSIRGLQRVVEVEGLRRADGAGDSGLLSALRKQVALLA